MLVAVRWAVDGFDAMTWRARPERRRCAGARPHRLRGGLQLRRRVAVQAERGL